MLAHPDFEIGLDISRLPHAAVAAFCRCVADIGGYLHFDAADVSVTAGMDDGEVLSLILSWASEVQASGAIVAAKSMLAEPLHDTRAIRRYRYDATIDVLEAGARRD